MTFDIHNLKDLGISLKDEMESSLKESIVADLKEDIKKEIQGLSIEKKLEALKALTNTGEENMEDSELVKTIMDSLKS